MKEKYVEPNQFQDEKHAVPPQRVSFKYRSGAAALRCLSDGLAYFAKPSEFNDCLEAKFDHSSAVDYIERMDRSIKDVAEQRGCADLSTFRAICGSAGHDQEVGPDSGVNFEEYGPIG
ncbi:MAG: hypothetical protein QE265_09945 [Rhodoferax sp.]|nr:hypothetical protein [Rhodoferax sp.]